MAATTPENLKNSADEFAAGFDAPDAPGNEQTEDQAFGLDLPTDGGDGESKSGSDGAALDAVVIVADGAPAGDKADKDPTAGTGEMGQGDDTTTGVTDPAIDLKAQPGAEGGDDEPTDPKDIQRKKSWEGRLKAEERRLAAVAAELEAKAASAGKPETEVVASAIDQVSDKADEAGQDELADKAGDIAEKVSAGEISVDDAVKMLAEDFGEPFVKMIEAVASAAASKAVGSKISELEEGTAAIIDHIKSGAEKAHFQAIYDAHPDFAELAKDPAFEAWRDADPARQATASGGSAKEINDLLSEYKAQAGEGGGEPEVVADGGEPAAAAPTPEVVADAQQEELVAEVDPEDEVDEDAADAAAGVRSAGMQLPEQPTAADDYAGSWEQFNKEDRRKA